MLQIKITATVYDAGEPKYLAGKAYPVCEDTKRQVRLGNGTEVDEPTDEELAAQAEALAAQQAERPAASEDAQPTAAQQPTAPTPARKRAAG